MRSQNPGTVTIPVGDDEHSSTQDKGPLTWRECLAIGLSGFVGSMIAVFADLAQPRQGSALVTIHQQLDQYLVLSWTTEWAVTTVPALVIFVMLFLGVALCFIFEVRSKRAGLYVGASVISLIATLVPYQAASGVGTEASGGSLPASSIALQSQSFVKIVQPGFHHVVLEVDGETQPLQATVELRSADTHQVIGRTTYPLGARSSRIEFSQEPGRYILTVDAPGYSSYHCSFELDGDVTFALALQDSGFLGPLRDFLSTRVEPCRRLDDES